MTAAPPPAGRPPRPTGPVVYARTGPHGPRWPEGRYGRRGQERKPNKWVLVPLTLAVAFLLAVLLVRNLPDLNAEAQAFEVRSDDTVAITVRVVRDPARDVQCLVRSRGADGREVGREEVDLPADPGGERVGGFTAEVTTTARAVTGELVGCRYRDE